MVKIGSGKRRFLVNFQYMCKKDMYLNQLNVVSVDSIPMKVESEVPTIYAISDEIVYLDKG